MMNKNEIDIDDYTSKFSKARMEYHKCNYAIDYLK